MLRNKLEEEEQHLVTFRRMELKKYQDFYIFWEYDVDVYIT